jgi:hypothetical protein
MVGFSGVAAFYYQADLAAAVGGDQMVVYRSYG